MLSPNRWTLLELGDSEVGLTVADDGRGSDTLREFPGHLGLQSMRERAAAVGGTLEIQSAPGEGTRLRARFPLAAQYLMCFARETIMEPFTTPIRILIADDHEVVRQGLRVGLGVDPELEVVLMDLLKPEMDGMAATEVIRRELPDTEVVALTSVLEDASVVGAVRAGAIGYLLKDTRAPERPEALSERELDVLRLLARGLANKEISRDLGIAEKTVKTHVSSVLGKLGVQSRTQAALYAGRVGMVPINQLGATEPTDERGSPNAGRGFTPNRR